MESILCSHQSWLFCVYTSGDELSAGVGGWDRWKNGHPSGTVHVVLGTACLCFPQVHKDLPSGSVPKNPRANAGDAGDTGSIPGSGRSPGKGNSNPLQYSCLENSTDRGTRRAVVHGVTTIRHDLATKPLPYSSGRYKPMGGTPEGRGGNVTIVEYLRCFVS